MTTVWPGPHTATVWKGRTGHFGWRCSCQHAGQDGYVDERVCRDDAFEHQRVGTEQYRRLRGVQFTRRVPAYDTPLECLAEHGHMVTGDHVEQDAWLCERPNEVGDVILFDHRIGATMLGGIRQTVVTRHSKGYKR